MPFFKLTLANDKLWGRNCRMTQRGSGYLVLKFCLLLGFLYCNSTCSESRANSYPQLLANNAVS